jgi:ArsR family transcriptional regulator
MVLELEIGQDFLQISEVFSALGSPIRLKIIEIISQTERPLHIKAIAKVLKKDYAAIYRHIKVLEKSGIIGIYEVGRSRVIYPKNDKLIKECIVAVKKILQIH